MVWVCALIIAAVTFIICIAGLLIGKKVGTVLAGKANILGGIILIGIGIEIFVKGVFFSDICLSKAHRKVKILLRAFLIPFSSSLFH